MVWGGVGSAILWGQERGGQDLSQDVEVGETQSTLKNGNRFMSRIVLDLKLFPQITPA